MTRCRLLLSVLLAAGCAKAPDVEQVDAPVSPAADSTQTVGDAGIRKLKSAHLPNPVQLHPRVISGGLPEGDAAFQELADLGVKTIISVDGMTPDVETAGRFGMRYVHLPHGYDGISEQRSQELAKAVKELDGPIYIHCHHGKHRSPAAASVACVSAGLIPAELAIPVLKLAGTSTGYQGLYQSAGEAAEIDATLLDALQVEFPEVQEIPPLAEAMVRMSHALDHLKLIARSDWQTPADHPDLEPAHEALLMRELFTELLRTDQVAAEPEDFRAWLQDSEAAGRALEAALREWQSTSPQSPPPQQFMTLVDRISANCKSCHVKYRDVPLSEK